MRICILDKNNNRCINILDVVNESDWADHGDFIRSPRNDGEIGWTLLPDGTWSDPTPQPTLEDRILRTRQRRDKYLQVFVDSINAVRWSNMTTEQQLAWTQYRQALLDVPSQPGFPDNVDWPTLPTG